MNKKIKFSSDDTLSQQCYEQLQNEIIRGILRPGQKLKVMPIKERFGVGQSPVREALSRLAACGLVAIEGNKGFKVATVSENDIRDTYAIFTEIENLAIELAIKNGNAVWQAAVVAELYKLGLIETKAKSVSYTEWAEQNYNFHVALIAGCNSPTLLEIRRNLYMKFDRYCKMSYELNKEELTINHKEHKKLVETILKKDIGKAQEIMTHHINGPIEDIIKQFKKNDLI